MKPIDFMWCCNNMNVCSYISKSMKPLYLEKVSKATTAFKILSDPTRFKILLFLFESEGELCVTDIAEKVSISHSAASHQLSKLEAHNIVFSYRDGQAVCYEVNDNELVNNLRQVMYTFIH